MNTPIMPQNLQSMLRYSFETKDVDAIIHYNRIWNAHVKEVREEYKKELEQSEGHYNDGE